jgi:hypothetical protein
VSNVPFLSSLFSSLWHGLSSHDVPGAEATTPGSADTLFHAGCPLVNVDGTPMLDCTLDVLGKPYGDSGPSFTDSSGMPGFDLHTSDW